jgi:hypothetical protein
MLMPVRPGMLYRREMCQKAGLRGLVVVGCGEKAGVGPELLCGHRELYGLSGAVGPGTRDDGHLPPGVLYRKLYDLFVFLVGKCRGLTRRSAGHDAVDTPRHLELDEFLQCLLVESAAAKRRDKRRVYTFQFHSFSFHKSASSCSSPL